MGTAFKLFAADGATADRWRHAKIVARGHARGHEAGAYDVDAHAARAPVGAQRLAPDANRGLAGAIGRRTGQATKPGQRRNDRDLATAARPHGIQDRSDRIHHAVDIDRENAAGLLGTLRAVAGSGRNARIRDDQIEWRGRIHGGNEGRHRVPVCNIAHGNFNGGSLGRAQRRHFGEPLLVLAGQGEPHAGPGQFLREGGSETRGAASDQNAAPASHDVVPFPGHCITVYVPFDDSDA